jgi:hypothetical protein
MSKLSALKVKSITAIGMHSDGLGLHLKVQKSKDGNSLNKSWIYRWGAQGANTIGLGSVKTVSLSEARDKADRCRKLVASGLNPKDERSKSKAIIAKEKASSITFKEATKIYIETHKAGWRNKKHASQWANTLKKYAEPTIGDVACSAITKEQLLSILLPIWTDKHETATRVRGRIESILDWAIAKDYRQAPNVAILKGNLAPLLPHINKRDKVKHYEAMNYDDIPQFQHVPYSFAFLLQRDHQKL